MLLKDPFKKPVWQEPAYGSNGHAGLGDESVKGPKGVSRYRAIDLTLFAVMLAVFETLAYTAATRLFPREPYTVSVTPLITAIVMMRWGPWAALHAALGGFVFCRAGGATWTQYAAYCGGNLLSLAALWPLRKAGRETVRASAGKTLLFGLAVTVLMQAGRALVSLCLGHAPAGALLFFTTDVISLLFTLVVLWIVRRQDGVFEDQRHYLLRLRMEQERQKEEGGFR